MARKQTNNKLNDALRRLVVIRLAQYDNPKDIAADLLEFHGIDVSTVSVARYDYTRGHAPAKKWVQLFDDARAHFLANVTEYVPTANKAVRMRMLDKAANTYHQKGNYIGMARMLEGIAKEDGGAFSNRREITGKGGGPVAYQDVADMSPEEVKAELVQLLSEAMGQTA